MSNYVNAPATKLVATHCCCCGRPLVDADSVESGVGPICREKHGYGVPQAEPDWAGAAAAIVTSGLEVTVSEAAGAHKLANVLTHRAALVQGTVKVYPIAAAIAALGYRVLAAKISTNAGAIEVEQVDDEELGKCFSVKAPYSRQFNCLIYQSGAKQRWDKPSKTRRVAVADRAKLVDALRSAFAGKAIAGPDGVKTLRKATKKAA